MKSLGPILSIGLSIGMIMLSALVTFSKNFSMASLSSGESSSISRFVLSLSLQYVISPPFPLYVKKRSFEYIFTLSSSMPISCQSSFIALPFLLHMR